jgi:hypothetical protein
MTKPLLSSTALSFNVLILKKMLDKHFTISSVTLFGVMLFSDIRAEQYKNDHQLQRP